jgi:hypothetical protein
MASSVRAFGLSQRDIRPLGSGRTMQASDSTVSSRDLRSPLDDLLVWLRPVLPQLQELASLPADWDGYGAAPVSGETTRDVLELLRSVFTSPIDPLPAFVPGIEGSVNVVWHREGKELELEVAPNGSVMVYFADEDEGTEWEAPYVRVASHVGELLSIFSDRGISAKQ